MSAACQALRWTSSRSNVPAGTAITRIRSATPTGGSGGIGRDQGSVGSGTASTSSTARAGAIVRVNQLTQSKDGQAGNTPLVETSPRVGLNPTIPLNAAGTRPLPAVSVPNASGTIPAGTARALPGLL